ncbi:MAG: DUF4157 domain-containing protein [Alphaproteobacteria bacterium]|nr:DUF4157 domain-containing protein [Alphaproteobacteria bacterium]
MADRINSAMAGLEGAKGAQSKATPLPHRDAMEASFGRHDLSSIQAHSDVQSVAASRAVGAGAYSQGNKIAFAGSPDLHTAAHEAAHVVQQRGGATPNPKQQAAQLAKELSQGIKAPHEGRVVVTPPSQPATTEQSLGAAQSTVKNLAKNEQQQPSAASSASAAAAEMQGRAGA